MSLNSEYEDLLTNICYKTEGYNSNEKWMHDFIK